MAPLFDPSRAVGTEWKPPPSEILTDQSILLQSEEGDYAHHIINPPSPRFSYLPTALPRC